MKPAPVYLKPGDVVELGIDGLGRSRQEVVGAFMTRHVLAVDLKDDPAVDRRVQRTSPARLAGSARAASAGQASRDMEIYLLGRRLVMVVDTGRPRSCAALRGAPGVRSARRRMGSADEVDAGAGPRAPARRMVGARWSRVFHRHGQTDRGLTAHPGLAAARRTPRPIVIIGAGAIVRTAHLPVYRRLGFPVAGLFDIDTERARADRGARSAIDACFDRSRRPCRRVASSSTSRCPAIRSSAS